MNWEPWSCTNNDCHAAVWLAQRPLAQLELWWVAADSDDRPFSVAAPAPIARAAERLWRLPICSKLIRARPCILRSRRLSWLVASRSDYDG
jgi:hypothetical protein